MIKFNNLVNEKPYLIFKEMYVQALNANQKNIEAMSISSYNESTKMVNNRFVNLKFVNKDRFIFFTNYKSPKSVEFNSHKQVAAVLFWGNTNTQIRIVGNIKKTSSAFNEKYFKTRSSYKNALAISSNQSSKINSYDEVIKKYTHAFEGSKVLSCPSYWGGYCIEAFEIEFWKGNRSRLNKRDLYKKQNMKWQHSILEP
jgi:pyridoxamine 5'-phosphate oxidase